MIYLFWTLILLILTAYWKWGRGNCFAQWLSLPLFFLGMYGFHWISSLDEIFVVEADTLLWTAPAPNSPLGSRSVLIRAEDYAAAGLNQPSLDQHGKVFAADIGITARDRVQQVIATQHFSCNQNRCAIDIYRMGGSRNLRCKADPNCRALRDLLVGEGLAWGRIGLRTNKMRMLQFSACEQKKGIWAGGPEQIPPHIWNARSSDDASQLNRWHCHRLLDPLEK